MISNLPTKDELTVFECRVSVEGFIEFVQLDGTVRAALRSSFVEKYYIPALEKCMKLKLKKFDFTITVGKQNLRVILLKRHVGHHYRMMKRGVKMIKDYKDTIQEEI